MPEGNGMVPGRALKKYFGMQLSIIFTQLKISKINSGQIRQGQGDDAWLRKCCLLVGVTYIDLP